MSSTEQLDGATAQRFFSQGKRIPKDVKRHCGMCKQHGVFVETRGHTCEYKDCTCEQCELVRRRREIMSTQIRLRREQDKKFQRTNDVTEADVVPWAAAGDDHTKIPDNINMCYFCQKCKNHGVLMWKKDHKKKCEYAECRCEQCDLIDSRRALDRHIKKRRMSMKGGTAVEEDKPKKSPRNEGGSTCQSEESSSSSDSSESNTALLAPPNFRMSRSSPFLSTNSTTSPTSSPLENVSPMPLTIPQITATSTISPFPFLNIPLVSPTTTTFPYSPLYNPFLTPLNMQIFFNNIQAISEMTAAVSLANTD